MKAKEVIKRLPMNIQVFAEGNDSTDDGSTASVGPEGTTATPAAEPSKEMVKIADVEFEAVDGMVKLEDLQKVGKSYTHAVQEMVKQKELAKQAKTQESKLDGKQVIDNTTFEFLVEEAKIGRQQREANQFSELVGSAYKEMEQENPGIFNLVKDGLTKELGGLSHDFKKEALKTGPNAIKSLAKIMAGEQAWNNAIKADPKTVLEDKETKQKLEADALKNLKVDEGTPSFLMGENGKVSGTVNDELLNKDNSELTISEIKKKRDLERRYKIER